MKIYRLEHKQRLAIGLEMTDILHYAMPFGVLGRLAHGLFVRRLVRGIFDHRIGVLEGIFGPISS